MKKSLSICLLLTLTFGASIRAQEPVDELVVARIKMEGFQHSHLMETLGYLTDVYGPRLKGSANYRAAAEWAREVLIKWGMQNVNLEPGGYTGPGWLLKRFSVEMTEPQYMHISAYPMAWSPSTAGVIAGKPILVDIKAPADFAKYRGKLKGAIVLNGRPTNAMATHFVADGKRFTDEELQAADRATDPSEMHSDRSPFTPFAEVEKAARERLGLRAAIARFFRDEGAAVVLTASSRDSGVIRIADAGGFDMSKKGDEFRVPASELAPPSFSLAREHYGRIARLLQKNLPVSLAVNVEATVTDIVTDVNVIAEIVGSDPRLKDEVVMLGGHLDSWHAGTGATDNAAGCSVMMEAMRILKAIGARPRRTVRVALWNGEEGGLWGSAAYVKKHFGDPHTMTLKPEHEKLSAYFNMDNGTGRIRGVYLMGNEAVRPIFQSWLRPFNYLGATSLAIQRVGGTDHLSFDYVGLPAFPFLQDGLDYTLRTHHTNQDVYESVVEEDLKQAAVIIASFVYHTAMRDEKLPRKPVAKVSP